MVLIEWVLLQPVAFLTWPQCAVCKRNKYPMYALVYNSAWVDCLLRGWSARQSRQCMQVKVHWQLLHNTRSAAAVSSNGTALLSSRCTIPSACELYD